MSTATTGETPAAHDEPLHLERHGIDHIPASERHGKPYTLFTFWAASNVQLLAISVGALAIVFGLSLPWAIFSIIVGNAFGGLYMALHSVQGPRLGLPQMMQSRAQFGMNGTALPNIIVILMYLGYFVAAAVVGGLAVASLFHVTTAEGIIIINAFVLLIVWFGYDLFHAFNKYVTYLSTAVFLAILIKLLTILPAHLPAGHNTFGAVLLAISVFVAWQVTWAPYVSDYSRYMPEDTSSWKVFNYTYIGSVVGASLVMIIGAIAAVVAGAAVSANAPDYLGGLFNVKWLFLIVLILGVAAGNFGNLYGPFLTLFAIISPSGSLASDKTGRIARIVTTSVLAIVGTVIAIQASKNFMDDLTNFLVFTLYLLVPWTAINLTDYYIVRNGHYNIPEMFKEDGIYGKVNWYAIIVYVLAIGIQFPFMNDPAIYVGSIANSLGGADLAWIVGFLFAAVAYYLGARYKLFPSARSGADAIYAPSPSEGTPSA
jgi:nucleobase:cation symporter-1, NCS1 family